MGVNTNQIRFYPLFPCMPIVALAKVGHPLAIFLLLTSLVSCSAPSGNLSKENSTCNSIHGFQLIGSQTKDTMNRKHDRSDTSPSYPGGISALKEYFRTNIGCVESVGFGAESAYTDTDCHKKLYDVILEIDSLGKIISVTLPDELTKQDLQPCLDNLKKMPKWNPGKYLGRNTESGIILYILVK